MFLLRWPDTGTTMLLDEWKTLTSKISADIVQELRTMDPDAAQEQIRAFSVASVPAYFQDRPLGLQARQALHYNAGKEEITVDHLPKMPDGTPFYKGLKFEFDRTRHTVLDYKDVMRILGLMRGLASMVGVVPRSRH